MRYLTNNLSPWWTWPSLGSFESASGGVALEIFPRYFIGNHCPKPPASLKRAGYKKNPPSYADPRPSFPKKRNVSGLRILSSPHSSYPVLFFRYFWPHFPLGVGDKASDRLVFWAFWTSLGDCLLWSPPSHQGFHGKEFLYRSQSSKIYFKPRALFRSWSASDERTDADAILVATCGFFSPRNSLVYFWWFLLPSSSSSKKEPGTSQVSTCIINCQSFFLLSFPFSRSVRSYPPLSKRALDDHETVFLFSIRIQWRGLGSQWCHEISHN